MQSMSKVIAAFLLSAPLPASAASGTGTSLAAAPSRAAYSALELAQAMSQGGASLQRVAIDGNRSEGQAAAVAAAWDGKRRGYSLAKPPRASVKSGSADVPRPSQRKRLLLAAGGLPLLGGGLALRAIFAGVVGMGWIVAPAVLLMTLGCLLLGAAFE